MPSEAETSVRVVTEGEHLSEIAYSCGTTPDAIWDHPSNATLKKTRKSYHLLAAGDVVYIPKPSRTWTSVTPGSTKNFTAKVPTINVNMHLTDESGPLKNQPYIAHTRLPVQGTTDDAGTVQFKASVFEKIIRLELPNLEHSILLHVGDLDPVDTDSGIRTRLHHLGFLKRAPEEATEAQLRDALIAFQTSAKVTLSGMADDATVSALESKFGC